MKKMPKGTKSDGTPSSTGRPKKNISNNIDPIRLKKAMDLMKLMEEEDTEKIINANSSAPQNNPLINSQSISAVNNKLENNSQKPPVYEQTNEILPQINNNRKEGFFSKILPKKKGKKEEEIILPNLPSIPPLDIKFPLNKDFETPQTPPRTVKMLGWWQRILNAGNLKKLRKYQKYMKENYYTEITERRINQMAEKILEITKDYEIYDDQGIPLNRETILMNYKMSQTQKKEEFMKMVDDLIIELERLN
jgi:hypothetical protein